MYLGKYKNKNKTNLSIALSDISSNKTESESTCDNGRGFLMTSRARSVFPLKDCLWISNAIRRISNNSNRRQKKTTVVVSAELSPHFRCNQEYAQFLFFQDRPWITEAPKIKASFLFPQNYLWISDVIKIADNFCVFSGIALGFPILKKKKKKKSRRRKKEANRIFLF